MMLEGPLRAERPKAHVGLIPRPMGIQKRFLKGVAYEVSVLETLVLTAT